MTTTDLTKQPPRSPRVRLGGYVLLPRLLDKCRAEIAGKSGDYHYNCPLDQQFLSFVGIDAQLLKEAVATGKGDGEILDWINAHASLRRTPWEVAQWSAWRDQVAPSDFETREFFNGMHKEAGPNRTDVVTWSDMLDLDDYVSFGGKA
jgi:hypothetical protein